MHPASGAAGIAMGVTQVPVNLGPLRCPLSFLASQLCRLSLTRFLTLKFLNSSQNLSR